MRMPVGAWSIGWRTPRAAHPSRRCSRRRCAASATWAASGRAASWRQSCSTPAAAKRCGHEDPAVRREAAWLIGARASDAKTFDEVARRTLGQALLAAERRCAEGFAKAGGEKATAEAEAWVRVLWAGAGLGETGFA